MWHYTGPEDSAGTNVECVTGEMVESWVLNITGACENPRGARRVKPFRADNPSPNEAWTNWFSPVSNENPAEEEEAASTAPPVAPVVPSARSTKRTRDSVAEPAGQPSKAAKPSGSKPRKALPRMRVTVPVTSTAATSATSPPRQGDDPMDMDNVVTSQPEVIPVEEDDQERPKQATVPVLEAVPPVTTPAMDAPPTETMSSTETTLIAVEPTGAGLGMPKESLVVLGPSTVQYAARRLPED
ncbi:hypothetical protein ZWY2020_014515 [Hordeum vulgare]|nr:hypothetical protein ZWY2020_014515 [Hordeum vulgare]